MTAPVTTPSTPVGTPGSTDPSRDANAHNGAAAAAATTPGPTTPGPTTTAPNGDTDIDPGSSPTAADTDADGLTDAFEKLAGTDPAAILGPSDITDLAPITSQFGWRQDPINGSARFHKGLDIAVAYGADVKAAAPGRVSFSGVQNGYGNTVVIDHEGGRQTRYAHLSEQLVRVGDVVAEGQLVGKSGNSGRATGPHLHFELLVNGQPVDPFGT